MQRTIGTKTARIAAHAVGGWLLMAATWLLLLYLFVAPAMAQGTQSHVQTEIIFPGQTVSSSFPLWDPADGVLTGVELVCRTEMQNPAAIGPVTGNGCGLLVTNIMPGSAAWTAWAECGSGELGPWSKTRLVVGGMPILAPRVQAEFLYQEVENDSPLNFESKADISDPPQDVESILYTDPVDLDRFTGTGSFPWSMETSYGNNPTTSGSHTSASIGWFDQSQAEVHYTFEPLPGSAPGDTPNPRQVFELPWTPAPQNHVIELRQSPKPLEAVLVTVEGDASFSYYLDTAGDVPGTCTSHGACKLEFPNWALSTPFGHASQPLPDELWVWRPVSYRDEWRIEWPSTLAALEGDGSVLVPMTQWATSRATAPPSFVFAATNHTAHRVTVEYVLAAEDPR